MGRPIIIGVLIINKPFKGAPFLAGFPGTIPLISLPVSAEKTCHLGSQSVDIQDV